MKLIVGLGNPGRKYEGTRHNIGFEVLAKFAGRVMAEPSRARFDADVAEANFAGERLLLLWPTTFMNLSGTSVLKARDFFKVADEGILVICDDINLPLGRLRIRQRGSSGGQKGLADILRRLGTEEVSRLRVGVGQVPAGWDAADFVLGKFSKAEQPEIESAVDNAAQAIECWVRDGVEVGMNQYN